MKPSVRLAKVLARALVTGPGDPESRPTADDPHVETFTSWRVLPSDLDLFGHMNNSRYLLLMDYARIDFLGRLGLLPTAIRGRWVIPVGSAHVDFRGALKPFTRFEIGTQVLSWNDRWFYMRQTFRSSESPQRAYATAHVKVIFRSPAGLLSPAEVERLAVQVDVPPPVMDDDTRLRFGLPPLPGAFAPRVAS